MKSKKNPLRLLNRHGCSESVINHCTAVSEQALRIAQACSIDINRELLSQGALLHDIGRGISQRIDHGIVGAEIARNEGLPAELQNIIERHIGAGRSQQEAGALGLPIKDYMPRTPEEIVVSYADNLTSGIHTITFEQALRGFKNRLGDSHPAVMRFIKQHEVISEWSK